MTCINCKELTKLLPTVKNKEGYLASAQRLKQVYNLKYNEEEVFSVIELANKINKREKNKANKS